MPRRNTKNAPAAAQKEVKVEEVVVEEQEIEEVEESEEPEQSEEEQSEEEQSEADEEEEDEEDEEAEEAEEEEEEEEEDTKPKRHKRTAVERIDRILELLANIKIPNEVTKELTHLRKQLVPEKTKRAPNAYNIFISDKMKEIKPQYPGTKPTELFKICIQMWRDHKATL